MADTTKSVRLRIVADAGTAKETLDDIAAKTDDLETKTASIKINVNKGTTKADLDEISARADAMGFKKVSITVSADTTRAEEKIDSLKAKIAALAAEADAGQAAMGLFTTGLMALAPALIPIGAATLSITAGLLPALAAGGIGLGVFAVAAKGAFSEVTAADAANKKLTGGLGEMQTQLNTAKTDWQSWIAQSADGIGHTLAPALSLVPTLLKYATTFLKPAEDGIRTLSIQLKNVFQSSGAHEFAQEMAGQVAPAIVNLGDAFGLVLHGIGGLFKDLIPQAGGVEKLIMKISGAFDKWANSAKTANGIRDLFAYFQQTGPKVGQVFKELVHDIPKILSALKGFGAGSLSGISLILTVIGKMSPGELQLIAGGFLAIRAATNLWRLAVIALNIVSDMNPWLLALGAVIAITILVVTHFKAIENAVASVFNWIKSHWPLILTILTGPIGLAVKFIVSHWNDIVSGAKSMVGSLIGFFTGLPGRIISALSSLANSMFNIGSNIIWGVIHGVESAAGTLFSYIGNIGKSISNVFSSVLSIFSPSRVFASHGRNIVLGLVAGIKENAPQATGAIADLGRAVSGSLNVSTPTGGLATRGSGNTYTFNVTVSGLVGDAGATGRQIVEAANTYLRQTGQPALAGA